MRFSDRGLYCVDDLSGVQSRVSYDIDVPLTYS